MAPQHAGTRKKSAVTLILVIALLLGALPTRAEAVDVFLLSPEALLAEGLAAGMAVIDLSPCRLPVEQVGTLFAQVMNDRPELFHVGRQLRYTCDAAGMVLSVMPTYIMEGEALADARRLYMDTIDSFRDAWAQQCRAGIDGGHAWSEADTVLFLHDWLAVRYDYDTSYTRYDVFSLFRDGVGVCQAYALGFLALGRSVGLMVEVVTSAAMDHAWNHVRVGDAWYHVDVTRDDPIRPAGETDGMVEHSRLLLDDQAMAALGYHDYTCPAGHICADTTFEDDSGAALLADLHSALICLPGGWMTICRGLPSWVAWPPDGDATRSLPGDMDRDGQQTVADLLWMRTLPGMDACAPAMRELLLRREEP